MSVKKAGAAAGKTKATVTALESGLRESEQKAKAADKESRLARKTLKAAK